MKKIFFNPEKINGIGGTLLLHSILIVVFLLVGFTVPIPVTKQDVIEIEMGGGSSGGGDNTNAKDIGQIQSVIKSSGGEVLKTLDAENVVKVSSTSKISPQQDITQVVDPNSLYKGNKNRKGGGKGNSIGLGNTSGNQSGDKWGDKPGDGDGTVPGISPSISLTGRKASYISLPDNKFADEGTVVVRVWVSAKGEVVRAEATSKGSSTTNTQLWRLATAAALKTTFSAKADAAVEQMGTITYHFVHKN
ncbi:MAG: energy transducer TonB [Bacteroidota bacterium]